ncbi:hypothetical protein DFH09DRAFT_1105423 [Mycena vulgaris]|nr:hypothetical protein DFH09DRAFT_1105423 [Mycena vulgaris]
MPEMSVIIIETTIDEINALYNSTNEFKTTLSILPLAGSFKLSGTYDEGCGVPPIGSYCKGECLDHEESTYRVILAPREALSAPSPCRQLASPAPLRPYLPTSHLPLNATQSDPHIPRDRVINQTPVRPRSRAHAFVLVGGEARRPGLEFASAGIQASNLRARDSSLGFDSRYASNFASADYGLECPGFEPAFFGERVDAEIRDVDCEHEECDCDLRSIVRAAKAWGLGFERLHDDLRARGFRCKAWTWTWTWMMAIPDLIVTMAGMQRRRARTSGQASVEGRDGAGRDGVARGMREGEMQEKKCMTGKRMEANGADGGKEYAAGARSWQPVHGRDWGEVLGAGGALCEARAAERGEAEGRMQTIKRRNRRDDGEDEGSGWRGLEGERRGRGKARSGRCWRRRRRLSLLRGRGAGEGGPRERGVDNIELVELERTG